MKEVMAEPIDSIGSIAFLTAFAAFLSALVTMCISPPESRKEWIVAIISTVICSISGGSYVVMKFALQNWTESHFGLAALFGLVFACGLPGWSLVRWLFNSLRAKEGMKLEDVISDIKDLK